MPPAPPSPPGVWRRLLQRLGLHRPAADNRSLGRRGEQAAEKYLRGKGYRVLERNWRCPQGEVDLIAQDGATLVIVEVKSGQAGAAVAPQAHVSQGKQRQLLRLAEIYRKTRKLLGQSVRIDVVEVLWGKDHTISELRHHPGAVWDKRR